MIHVQAVGQLMRHDVATNLRRREQQPPIEANPSIMAATAPTRSRVADLDARDRDAFRLGQSHRLIGQSTARFGLQPPRKSSGKALYRSADADPSVRELDAPWAFGPGQQAMRNSVEEKFGTGLQQNRLTLFRDLPGNPVALRGRPIERSST